MNEYSRFTIEIQTKTSIHLSPQGTTRLELYDYLKISYRIKNTVELLSKFDFEQTVISRSGELSRDYQLEYGETKIQVYDNGWIQIRLSFHEYFTNGENYSDFNLLNFVTAVEKLSSILDLNLWLFKPDTVEFGVNVSPVISTSRTLRYCILHAKKRFKDSAVKGEGNYRQAQYDQYIVKLYDKGKQYELDHELLRFELKYFSEKLRTLEINKLYDLLNPEIISQLQNQLIFHFNEILFIDPVIKNTTAGPKKQDQIYNWNNPNYWYELSEDKTHSDKNTFRREFYRCKSFIEMHTDNIQDKTKDRIVEKCGILVGFPIEHLITKLGKFGTSIIDQIFPDIRTCCITGLDISMQRKNSRFLSISGVEFYYKNHCDIYRELEERLSERWYNSSLKIQFREIAHSIRNEYFNNEYFLRCQIRLICSNKTLFPLEEIVPPKYLELFGLS